MDMFQHDDPDRYRFRLSGDLEGKWVLEVEHAWRTAVSALNDRELVVDVTELTQADSAGIALLSRMRKSGARIVAAAPPPSRSLAEFLGIAAASEMGTDVSGRSRILRALADRFFRAARWRFGVSPRTPREGSRQNAEVGENGAGL